jgi:hypothetical protein
MKVKEKITNSSFAPLRLCVIQICEKALCEL